MSYSEEGSVSRTLRSALSLLLLYTVASPIVTVIADIGDISIDSIVESAPEPDTDDPEYYKVAEEAFCEGIRKMVCDSHSVNAGDVAVYAFGFDFKSMSAQTIKIILSGSAVYADARGIAAEVSDAGLGECEVELEIS